MHHVFLSYSRTDAPVVDALDLELRRRGVPTWVDRTDLPFSLPWIDEIRDAISESALVVFVDSPASRQSAPCAAERSIAADQGTPTLDLPLAGPIPALADVVVSHARQVPASRWDATELAVRSRDWVRSGRDTSHLVTRRTRRRLAPHVGVVNAGAPDQRRFLRSSRRRSIRRAVVASVLSLLMVAGGLGTFLFIAVAGMVDDQNEQSAATMLEAGNKRVDTGDIYAALRQVSRLGRNESGLEAIALTTALARPVPDDLVRFDGPATFAERPIGDTVHLLTADGRHLARATASDSRTLEPTDRPLADGSDPSVTVEIDGSVVVVRRDGRLVSRTGNDAVPTAATVSPDGREVAIAVRNQVRIVTFGIPGVRLVLAGAPGTINDLAWTVDGTRIWAATDGAAVSWSRRSGAVIADLAEPARAMWHSARAGHVWVLARSGRLAEIDTATGAVVNELSVPGEAFDGDGDPSGRRAIVAGDNGGWVVDLETGATAPVDEAECLGAQPALDLANDVGYLPCIEGALLEVSLVDGKVLDRIDVPEGGANAVRHIEGSGELIVGGSRGGVFGLDRATGRLSTLRINECRRQIRAIAATDRPARIIPVGDDTGRVGCAAVAFGPSTSDLAWNVVIDGDLGNHSTRAVLLDGTAEFFVVGRGDGAVVTRSVENILPEVRDTAALGPVRDLLWREDGTSVLALTGTGIVQQVDVCTACATNDEQAKIARARLRRAGALGLG